MSEKEVLDYKKQRTGKPSAATSLAIKESHASWNEASDIEFARDWVLGRFFTTTSNPTVQHIETALGVSKPCQKLVGTEGWTSHHAPMVFALRGLVSSLRKEIVIQGCPSQLSLVPAIAN